MIKIQFFLLFLMIGKALSCEDREPTSTNPIKILLEEHVDELLSQYTRPFTVCYLGTINPWLIQQAQKYSHGIFVVIAKDPLDSFFDQCTYKDINNIILLKTKPSYKELKKLSSCEHFDLTIFNYPLDSFYLPATQIFKTILGMGDHILLNINFKDLNNRSIKTMLMNYKHSIYNTKNITTIMYIYTHKKFLLGNYWSRDTVKGSAKNPNRIYEIKCNFDNKFLIKTIKGKKYKSIWIPGINLDTYSHLKGSFPRKQEIFNKILLLKNTPHKDIKTHNMIIQGKVVKYIDLPTEMITNNAKKHEAKLIKIIANLNSILTRKA